LPNISSNFDATPLRFVVEQIGVNVERHRSRSVPSMRCRRW
jgi:hypothetical protein